MIQRTSTTYAPWTIVEANDKYYERIKVLKTVVAALERALDLPDDPYRGLPLPGQILQRTDSKGKKDKKKKT